MSDGESVTRSSSTPSEDRSQKDDDGCAHPPLTEEHLVQFNLTDPDDIEAKIASLSDEEMEQLLQQAYRVNSELKQELTRKEREQSACSSHTSQSATAKGRSEGVHLPPLRGERQRRGFTPLGPKTSAHQLYSSPVSSSRQKARMAAKESIKPRPEWNGRFGV